MRKKKEKKLSFIDRKIRKWELKRKWYEAYHMLAGIDCEMAEGLLYSAHTEKQMNSMEQKRQAIKSVIRDIEAAMEKL
jgi:hypothetical protein